MPLQVSAAEDNPHIFLGAVETERGLEGVWEDVFGDFKTRVVELPEPIGEEVNVLVQHVDRKVCFCWMDGSDVVVMDP